MRKTIAIAVIAALVGVLCTISYCSRPVAFTGLADADVRLKAAGFYCTYDGVANGGFMVSTVPMSREEVVALAGSRARGTMPADVAWVEVIEHNGWNVVPNGDYRVMGRVFVQGKREFLDTIEKALRR